MKGGTSCWRNRPRLSKYWLIWRRRNWKRHWSPLALIWINFLPRFLLTATLLCMRCTKWSSWKTISTKRRYKNTLLEHRKNKKKLRENNISRRWLGWSGVKRLHRKRKDTKTWVMLKKNQACCTYWWKRIAIFINSWGTPTCLIFSRVRISLWMGTRWSAVWWNFWKEKITHKNYLSRVLLTRFTLYQ